MYQEKQQKKWNIKKGFTIRGFKRVRRTGPKPLVSLAVVARGSFSLTTLLNNLKRGDKVCLLL